MTGLTQVKSKQHFKVEMSSAEDVKLERKFRNAAKRAKDADLLYAEMISMVYRNGYLLAQIDQRIEGDTVTYSVNLGKVYRWSNIGFNDETAGVLRKAHVDADRLLRKPISSKRTGRALDKALSYLENNGFPFAELGLDSVEINGENIACKIVLQKGPLVKIDSVIVLGDLEVREAFITNYLGIKEGSLYNEKNIKRISAELAEVGFINEFRPAEVRFNKSETKISLFLNRNRASRFDGIIGFLPDEKTGDILITGDVSLHLENSLKQGEIIDLRWRKLQSSTQDLEAGTVFPFVLNSPLSPDGKIHIYRRDTTFTDVFGQFGLRYVFRRSNYVRVFVDRQTTNLISTTQYEGITKPPPYLDRTILSYGLGMRFSKLDYLLNPSKGLEFEAEAAAGNKEIQVNPNLPIVIYDGLKLNSIQFKATANFAYYLSIIPRLVWHQRYLGAWLRNDQLFNNDAYRIGGFKTLRGFNEESIFATSYSIARNEIRYQIERNGYLFIHFDQAWYENRSVNKLGVRRDTPYAFGAGISIGTKAGVFSFSSALGSQQNNPILIRAAKFHFGFLSVF